MNKRWIEAAAIRAIKTMAQTAIATIGTTAVMNEVDWIVVLSASGLAGILSVLTSIAGLPEVKAERALETEAGADAEDAWKVSEVTERDVLAHEEETKE